MKKTILVSFIALALVLSSAGLTFASSSSDFFNSLNLSLCTISSVSDNSFALTRSSNSTGSASFNFISDASGSFSFSLSDSPSFDYQIFNPSGDVIYTSLPEGASLHPNGKTVVMNKNYTSGTIVFQTSSQTTTNKTVDFLVYQGCPSITFVFDDLIVNSEPVYSSVVGEVIDFAVPAGYAFIIDGECEIIERSYYINNSWNFRNIDDYRVNGSINRILGSSSIRDGFSPDRLRPSSELIHWEAINPNIFGTASTYEFYDGSLVTVGTGETYIISNPTLYGYGTTNSVILNTNAVDLICSVYIQYTTRPILRWVAIESLSEYSSSGSFSTYSVFRPDLVDEEGSSSSGSGGTVVTPENNLPTDGGNHGQPSVNDDSSLLGIFSRLTNLITNLFRDAIDAVQSIINAGSSFMQMVSAMFGWLPPELLGVLTSALILIVVIGVVKALL